MGLLTILDGADVIARHRHLQHLDGYVLSAMSPAAIAGLEIAPDIIGDRAAGAHACRSRSAPNIISARILNLVRVRHIRLHSCTRVAHGGMHGASWHHAGPAAHFFFSFLKIGIFF